MQAILLGIPAHGAASDVHCYGLQLLCAAWLGLVATLYAVVGVCSVHTPLLTVSCHLQVLVGSHALLANGGVMAPVGTRMVAQAAQKHSIPFVVLVGLHKLSPLFPHDPDISFNDFGVRTTAAWHGGRILWWWSLSTCLCPSRPCMLVASHGDPA